jgi:N-acetylglucosaminyl-diphospho-decaprenol L-rhamnosyltransferase
MMDVARKGPEFMMKENFRLGVVIVNYRTAELAIDCLASLAAPAAMPDGARVVVVDGGSGDGSASRIETAIAENRWGSRMSLLPLATNGGFAYGNNRGLDHMRAVFGDPDYFLFLNPDTVVRKTALAELLSFMDRTPDAGVAGSRLEDHDETRQACAFRFPSAVADLESEARIGLVTRLLRPWSVLPDVGDEPSLVDWVSGASMMVRSEVLRDIGVFDESFFLYYEEVDLCRRAGKAGWRCYHVPQSRVVHLVGRATGVTLRHAPLPRRPAYWFESRNRYFIKHHGSVYLAFADMAWMIGHIAYRAKHLLRGRASASPPYLLGDFIRHSLRT